MRSFAVEGSFRWVKPIPMAVDYLSQIQDRGHTIKIITARSHLADISPLLRRKIVSDTSAWLEHHHFDYDELHFTERKSEIPFDVLIDDGPRHLTDAYHVGRDVIVMSRTYNRDFHNGADSAHGIYRASTWWDIYDYIIDMEGI
jgi:5'(3')-deoxyribonucleotidase